MYASAEQFIREQDKAAAQKQLAILHRNAPYYGDPAGLAKEVGLPPAKNYEQALAEEQARKQALVEQQAREQALAEQQAWLKWSITSAPLPAQSRARWWPQTCRITVTGPSRMPSPIRSDWLPRERLGSVVEFGFVGQ